MVACWEPGILIYGLEPVKVDCGICMRRSILCWCVHYCTYFVMERLASESWVCGGCPRKARAGISKFLPLLLMI